MHCLCRAAHQRLVAHSEEVAFNDPPGGAAEQLILNQHLQRLITFSRLSSFQRFLQQVRINGARWDTEAAAAADLLVYECGCGSMSGLIIRKYPRTEV